MNTQTTSTAKHATRYTRRKLGDMTSAIAAWIRSGATDTLECEGCTIHAFAREFGYSFREAERIWNELKPQHA